MMLKSPAFEDGGSIPADNALCVPDPETTATLGPNRNPAFTWSDVPDRAASLVMICFDRSAPPKAEFDKAAAAGEEIAAETIRPGFYHWALVDLAPGAEIEAGEFSDGVTARGKDGPDGPKGTRSGRNDYTGWFEGDPDMEGTYFGYDGPCPPPMDSVVHEYVFTLYATDLERCPVEGEFVAEDVLAAIDGHVLAEASLTGTYALNPRLTS